MIENKTRNNFISSDFLDSLCEQFNDNNYFAPELYEKFQVKKGLRNQDGTGVMAGITKICNVLGYFIKEGERLPIDGELVYRGINIKDIIYGCLSEDRFGFEETTYLLLTGNLPNIEQLKSFNKMLGEAKELPPFFTDDMILKSPSPDIMNKLSHSILGLYSYDSNPEDTSLSNLMRQSVELIARLPAIIVGAYQVKKRYYDRESVFFHFPQENLSLAENFLTMMRPNMHYTLEEAQLLDMCLVLHAEHGGGNNSTFTARVLTSTGTDTYSAISAAVGSLKGPRHGGANVKVTEMFNFIKENVKDWDDEEELENYLIKMVKKEAGDKSGLIYGMGHAVYTLSDPRAIILKNSAKRLAEHSGVLNELLLMEKVEKLSPSAFKKVKGDVKVISANVDMYSGFVYSLLGIPEELHTPLFAMARISGWCAHRIEEVYTNRIIRPAYKSVSSEASYIPLMER